MPKKGCADSHASEGHGPECAGAQAPHPANSARIDHERSAGVIIYRHCHNASGGHRPDAQAQCAPEFLLIKSAKGHWDLPKGHVDSQLDRIAALRELQEETGIGETAMASGLEDFYTEITYTYEDAAGRHPKTVAYFLAKADCDVCLSPEHTAFRWVGLQDALALVVFPETQQLLKDAAAVLDRKQC